MGGKISEVKKNPTRQDTFTRHVNTRRSSYISLTSNSLNSPSLFGIQHTHNILCDKKPNACPNPTYDPSVITPQQIQDLEHKSTNADLLSICLGDVSLDMKQCTLTPYIRRSSNECYGTSQLKQHQNASGKPSLVIFGALRQINGMKIKINARK